MIIMENRQNVRSHRKKTFGNNMINKTHNEIMKLICPLTKRIIIILVLIALFCETSYSQKSQHNTIFFEGSVKDCIQNEPLVGTVITFHSLDGILLNGGVTNDNGNFTIKIQDGNIMDSDSLLVNLSHLGYETLSKKISVSNEAHSLGQICLSPLTMAMDEVTVTAKKTPYKFEYGSYKVLVESTELSKLSSANDVLLRIPLLSGSNGSFSVNGRGKAIIFIDKRKVRDETEIQNIDGSKIESIRIITDPDTSYPIGTNAVIEITLKKWYQNHLGVTAETEHNLRKRLSQYYTLRTNINKGKMSAMALLRYSDSKFDPNSNDFYSIFWQGNNKRYNVNGESTTNNLNLTLIHSLNYDLNTKNSLGYYFSLSRKPTRTSIYNELYKMDEIDMGTHFRKSKSKGYSVDGTFYYVGQIGNTSVNFQNFILYRNNTSNNVVSINDNIYNNTDLEAKSLMFDTKLELGNSFSKSNMNYGVQYTFTKRLDESNILIGRIDNTSLLSFNQIVAPFLNFKWAKDNLSFSVGMRGEFEINKFPSGEQNNTQDFYFNPKANLNYRFSSGLSASLSWQSFVSRPKYFILSGMSYQEYPFLISKGNPYLKNTINNNFYLNLSYKQHILQFRAKRISNNASVFYSYDPVLESIEKTFFNTPTYWDYAIAGISQVKIGDFWDVNLFGDLSYKVFAFGDNPQREYFKKPSYQVSITNTFKLGQGYTLNLYSSYSRILSGIEESLGAGGISGSLSKYFLSNKLYLSLSVGQYIQKMETMRTKINNIQIDQLWDTSNKYIGINFKYIFNRVSNKDKSDGGNNNEIRRL